MGWGGRSGNAHYSRLDKLVAAHMMGVSLGYVSKGWSVLSSGEYRQSYDNRWPGRRFFWTMRPAFAQALEELGMVERAVVSLELEPEFGELPPSDSQTPYPEGATRQITVNAYERNRAARQACVEYHGTICSVCDSDLGEVYGPIAYGFIHVHHLKTLSEVGAGYSVNPQADLVPVCPNCHAMLHRTSPPLTVEQLREMIQEAH